MNIFVMVDMEGISGICRKSQVLPGGEHYQEGRRYLTLDVNACVAGCIDGGAEVVTVRDAHGGGFHFLWDQLDSRAEYIQGRSARERMPGIAGYDGLILLGYHAMAGTPEAILEHTMSSVAWQNFYLNGEKAGEFAIDSGIGGDNGVPVIMTSGDDKLCGEAKSLIPEVIAVETKRGLDVEGGILLPAERAHAAIREGARQAVSTCADRKPYVVPAPVEMRLELVSRGNVPASRPGVTVIDGRTYSVRAETVEAALKLITG
jgi:D-amino peptidase